MFLNRFNIFLALMLVICALALVTSQHRARKLFVEQDRARAKTKVHETRWNELQLQQTQFGKTSLIDTKARKEMGMESVSPASLVHLEQILDPVARGIRGVTPRDGADKQGTDTGKGRTMPASNASISTEGR